jgi:hypothetical protein
MKINYCRQIVAAALAVVSLPAVVRAADVEVQWERKDADRATADFAFERIPRPSKQDAATNARVVLARGEEDPAGDEVFALVDGKLPSNRDEPGSNFFLGVGNKGGRVVMDLGQETPIVRISSYSWHAGGRGPQVYKVFARETMPRDPKQEVTVEENPERAGWQFIATVDTRTAGEKPGGQYGVSIARAGGAAIGSYRYLRFDLLPVNAGDIFGNTFYSEIDIDDGKPHEAVPFDPRKVSITINSDEMPQLKPWIDGKLRPACEKWYPIIAEMLASDGYVPPRSLTVTFKKDMEGVAGTVGTRVACAGPWFERNLEGEATGAVIHELAHVVQRYRGVRGGGQRPGWLVEGIADYVRWFRFEPASARPRPDPSRARYTDGYRTAAALLNFATERHDPQLVKKLNAALREGRYRDSLWPELAGKDLDSLWQEYLDFLKKK